MRALHSRAHDRVDRAVGARGAAAGGRRLRRLSWPPSSTAGISAERLADEGDRVAHLVTEERRPRRHPRASRGDRRLSWGRPQRRAASRDGWVRGQWLSGKAFPSAAPQGSCRQRNWRRIPVGCQQREESHVQADCSARCRTGGRPRCRPLLLAEERESWSSMWSSAKDSGSSWGEAASHEFGQAADRVTAAADHATTAAPDLAGELKGNASQAAQEAGTADDRVAETLDDATTAAGNLADEVKGRSAI